jgi:SNF2 family DNA or RNA helicase
MRYAPHLYQQAAIEFLLGNTYAGLFLDPGLGKTSVFLSVVNILKRSKQIKAALVIAPLRPCYMTWPNEITKWDDFRGLRMQVLHGPDKLRNLSKPADVYVINPDGLHWLFNDALRNVPHDKWPFDILGVDESQKFKNPGTQRFETLEPHLRKFKRRYILTGTPTPNSLIELFGQMYILDLGKALSPYLKEFHRKYCFEDDWGWIVVPGADKLIMKKIDHMVLSMRASDYLSLPDLQVNEVLIDLPKAVRNKYKEMQKELRTEFEFGRVTAANAGVKANKLRQIASGALYQGVDGLPHGGRWQPVHAEKVQAIVDLVDELNGHNVLIGYEYEHEAERLKKVFPKAVSLGGGVSPAKLQKAQDDWNSGKIKVLLNQMDSGALGLNLQGGGNHIILMTPTYKNESDDQFIKRVWRQGQASGKVIVHRIMAAGTVDIPIVREVLSGKAAGQNALLDALKVHLEE